MIEDNLTSATGPLDVNPGLESSYSPELLTEIARRFSIAEPIRINTFGGRGNINLTFSVMGGDRHYLLQRVNSDVFTMPHRVMNSMLASIEAQRQAIEEGLGDPTWEAIELVPTKDGKPFLELENDWSLWRLMVCIPEVVSFKSLSVAGEQAIFLAEETGRGLAIYTDLTSSMDPAGVEGALPGYRDTDLYYQQFRSVMAENRTLEEAMSFLPKDPIVRASTEKHFTVGLSHAAFQDRIHDPELQHFIQLVKDYEPTAMCLWNAIEESVIPRTLIHGDTKLENFLFGKEGFTVRSLVDLDTVMSFTWLADWGDMLRSLVNVAGECEEDLGKVVVDRQVYAAVAAGFLKTARKITEREVGLMATAVEAIALELGLRFLTDYLRGDTYFMLGSGEPANLNKTRAMVQLSLFEKLCEFREEAEEIIRLCRSQARRSDQSR